jgi:hypothetical protein
MSTLHTRHRRMLSASGRSTGPQLPLDQQNGRVPRMLNRSDFEDPISGARGIIFAILPSILIWLALIALYVWVIETLVGAS